MLKAKFCKLYLILILLIYGGGLSVHAQIPCDPNQDPFCPPLGGDPDVPLDDNIIYMVLITACYGVVVLKRRQRLKVDLLSKGESN